VRIRLKVVAAAVAAVAAGLTAVGCSGDDPPAGSTTSPATPSSAVAPSMTFDEANRKLPMDGTKDLPITWEVSGAQDTDLVLAARRSLAFIYWERASADWAPIIPLGRYFYTEEHYQKFLAPYANAIETNPLAGRLWIKYMGAEKTGADETTVTFCGDFGFLRSAKQPSPPARPQQWNLESYRMKKVMTGDGESHWLADGLIDNDGNREAKYGAQCAAWAKHKP
jgi:hypothetical protein